MTVEELNYICFAIDRELGESMRYKVLNELVKDFSDLSHDLEWFFSADIGEEDYCRTAEHFKNKWLRPEIVEKLGGFKYERPAEDFDDL